MPTLLSILALAPPFEIEGSTTPQGPICVVATSVYIVGMDAPIEVQ